MDGGIFMLQDSRNNRFLITHFFVLIIYVLILQEHFHKVFLYIIFHFGVCLPGESELKLIDFGMYFY